MNLQTQWFSALMSVLSIACGNSTQSDDSKTPDATTLAPIPAQEWVLSAGGASSEAVYSIAVDETGSTFITGFYSDDAAFGSKEALGIGRLDLYVAKLDPHGQVEWLATGGGDDFDFGYDIALDAAGNVYVTGYQYDFSWFGDHKMESLGFGDVLVAKLSPKGHFLWATSARGSSHNVGYGIDVDDAGNVYVTGTFQGTTTFGEADTLTSAGQNDMFVAKLSTDGAWQWATGFGSSHLEEESQSIAVDTEGNSYVIGSFGNTTTFGDIERTARGEQDVFVAKLDSAGSVLWVTQGGGSGRERGRGIAWDPTGKVYATGSFRDTATFGDVELVAPGAEGKQQVFVAKLSASDGAVDWAIDGGGEGEDLARDIRVAPDGTVYIAGFFRDTAQLGTTTLTSNGGMDLFAARITPSGQFTWATSAGDIVKDFARGVAVDRDGSVYLGGSYELRPTIGQTVLRSAGNEDVFVWKMLAPE